MFLKSGERCEIVQKLKDGKFLVELYKTFICDDYQEEEELSGEFKVVDKVFDTIESVSKETKEVIDLAKKELDGLKKECQDKKYELSMLNSELSKVRKRKTDMERFVIDRSDFLEAKRIIVFFEDKILPIIYYTDKHPEFKTKNNKLDSYNMKISFELRLIEGTPRMWHTQLYTDGNYGSSTHFSELYFDKTDEEIDEIIKSRIPKKDIKDWRDLGSSSKYLLEEQDKIRKTIEIGKFEKEIEKTKKDLLIYQEKVKDLEKGLYELQNNS